MPVQCVAVDEKADALAWPEAAGAGKVGNAVGSDAAREPEQLGRVLPLLFGCRVAFEAQGLRAGEHGSLHGGAESVARSSLSATKTRKGSYPSLQSPTRSRTVLAIP